ncbi:MAG: lipase, partial [Actinobacteria bacterium]|nr:lipase [Actinomycetota bacterium]
MRTRITLLVTAAAISLSLIPAPARAGEPGPALQTSPDVLAKALTCPATFKRTHNPVLFVHGTTLTAQSNWAWNYGKVLPARGYDVCLVELPDR